MIRQLLLLFLLILLSSCSEDSMEPEEDPNPLQLLSQITVPGRQFSDVWGYVDPGTGKEYALLGHFGPNPSGISIFDVSDPETPVQVAQMNDVPGFDLKAWQNYMYSVTGGSSGNGTITDISDPSAPIVVGTFPSSHNLTISENGLMVTESPGIRIYDLTADPTAPRLLWQGGRPDQGHDANIVGNRLFDFHGRSNTQIYNISSPAEPILEGVIADPTIEYHHSGYPTEDGNYLFLCDELAPAALPDITVWDISDLSNPTRVAEYRDANAIVHNIYIIGDLAYVSYYAAGLRIFDVSDPTDFKLIAEYDTSDQFASQGFNGAFGIYPYSPSGVLYVSDIENGLFLFRYNP
ncbi:MAG: LVIVD repeat-containing protein [Calditrichia bacterium]